MKSAQFFIDKRLQKFLDALTKAFLIFLPWSTITSVFLVYKLHIPGGNFLKEILLLWIVIIIGILFYKKWKITDKCPIEWSKLDTLILAYFLIMSVITIFTTGIRGLIFGGRYDFMFLIVFWIFYHGAEFLEKSPMHYIKYFLISG